MGLLERWRRYRVRRIEAAVAALNTLLADLEWDDLDGRRPLEERRRRLWLLRSDIVKKLPADYEKETPAP